MTTDRFARLTGWLLLAAAAFLTLSPPRFRPHTGVEHHLEHFLAFILLGLAFGVGYPGRRWVVAIVGVVVAAVLETSQSFVHGRHASLSDFAMNSCGMAAGLMAAALWDWARRRRPAA